MRVLAYGCAMAICLHAQQWDSGIRVLRTGEYSFADVIYNSSSQLRVEWTAHLGATLYRVKATDGRHRVSVEQPADSTGVTLEDLKSATKYVVHVEACREDTCESSPEIEATTGEEYWRVIGSGNSLAGARKLVPDGNVMV